MAGATGLLAGCGGGSDESSKGTPASGGATTGKSAGTLKVSVAADTTHFDIHQLAINGLQPLIPAYNDLITYDEQNPDKIVGDLAQSWELTNDGLRYTFKLLPGVKWHDGRDFTAQDVVYNVKRIASPPAGVSSQMKELFAVLDRVEAPDQSTVVLTFKSPYSSFIAQFASDYALAMLPPHVIEAKGDMKKDVVGTGPFRFKAYTAGSTLDLVRNESYFKPDRPRAAGVQTLILTDSNTRFEALRTGQVNLTGRIFAALTPSQAKQLGGAGGHVGGVRVVEAPGLQGPWYLFNTIRGLFRDARARRAVWMAFDKRGAIQALQEGFAKPGSFLPPGPWGLPDSQLSSTPGFRAQKDDLADAKKLLEAAGVRSGTPVKVEIRAVVRDAGEFLGQQLTLLGLQPQLHVYQDAEGSRIQEAMEFDIQCLQNVFRINDPDDLARKVLTNAAFNNGKFSNAQVDSLFAKQRSILKTEERVPVVRELDKLLMEEVPSFWPYWAAALMGVRDEVEGFKPPSGQYNGLKVETLAVKA